MHWCNIDDRTLDDATFKEGKTYCLELRLSPKTGYSFQFDPNNGYTGEATCDGKSPYDASRSNDTENRFIRFPCVTAIPATLYSLWVTGAPNTELVIYEHIDYYTVSFDMNGNGKAPADQKVVGGDTAAKPADPSAEGYTFGGWYADAACKTVFDFNSAINADTTVYAKWTKNAAEPTEPANPDAPQTGDNSNMMLWTLLVVCSGAALVGVTVYSKKRKHG